MHPRLRGTVLTLAVIATCLLAFAGPAVAIQFGQPDGARHPYVCLVQFYDAAGAPLWFTTGETDLPARRTDRRTRDVWCHERSCLVLE